jgi:hypothetical protein
MRSGVAAIAVASSAIPSVTTSTRSAARNAETPKAAKPEGCMAHVDKRSRGDDPDHRGADDGTVERRRQGALDSFGPMCGLRRPRLVSDPGKGVSGDGPDGPDSVRSQTGSDDL